MVAVNAGFKRTDGRWSRFPAMTSASGPYAGRAFEDPRNLFELHGPCPSCQNPDVHYMLDIRNVIDTDEEGVLQDDLTTRMRYRGTKYRLIKRECPTCHQQWDEVLDKEYGTWYETGDV